MCIRDRGQLGQVGNYNKELSAEAKQQAKEAAERAASAEEKIKFFPRSLSRHQFEEDRPAVLLAEEQHGGSLRSTAKQGSLLKDRFQSLQKRNVLSVGQRQRAGHGKHKLKVKTKTVINKNGTELNGLKEW
eukprot:TRINITY_DN14831_c0_g1_i2.p1 TRINITY_DN14831_c0_g1~~TRINITY_DN14831_c0_g1_i2.p1  ORF type:complete len:131 (+),score=56.09 TRINITY_DN14831_c0_g1_i2:110-502(+)